MSVNQIFETSEWWRRHEALIELMDYLERGARELVPPATRQPGNEWVELILRMKQGIPLQGDVVTRSIYSPPLSQRPSSLPEVVRQITWQAEVDRERSKGQLVIWPSVAVEYYEINDEQDWIHLDSEIRSVEGRLGRFPFDAPEAPGLSLTHRDYSPPTPPRAHEIGGRRMYSRDLYLHLTWGAVQYAFLEGQDSDFDAAWDEAWRVLTHICRSDNRVVGYEPHYLVAPESLSEFLAGVAK